MTQWQFVVAAYGVAIAGTAALLLWSALTMRRAEHRLDELQRR